MKRLICLLAVSCFLSAVCLIGVANGNDYQITVDFTQFRLTFTDADGNIITEAKVILPVPKKQYKLPVTGKVFAVDWKPTWYPSDEQVVASKIPLSAFKINKDGKYFIPYGYPHYPLGEVALRILYDQKWMTSRVLIHGTDKEIGENDNYRLSGGCIRVQNKNVVPMAKMIDSILKTEQAVGIFFHK